MTTAGSPATASLDAADKAVQSDAVEKEPSQASTDALPSHASENWREQRLQEQLDVTCSLVDQLRRELQQRSAAMHTLQAELEEQRQRTLHLERATLQLRATSTVSIRRVRTGEGAGTGHDLGTSAVSPSLLGSGTSMEDKELRHTSEVARLEAELEGLRHLVRALQDDVHRKSSALRKLDKELQSRVNRISRLEEEVDRQRQAVGKLRGQVHEGQQGAAAALAKSVQCDLLHSSRRSTPTSAVDSPIESQSGPQGPPSTNPFSKGPWGGTPTSDPTSSRGTTPRWGQRGAMSGVPSGFPSSPSSSAATPRSVIRHGGAASSSPSSTPRGLPPREKSMLDALRKQLHTANSRLQAMNQELDARSGLLLSLEQQLSMEMEATSRLEEELESKTATISSMAADLRAKVDTIKGLQRMLKTLKSALRQIDAELQAPPLQPNSPDSSLLDHSGSVEGIEAHVRGIQHQLKAKGQQLKALQDSVANKTKEVVVLEQDLSQKTESILQLERQVMDHMDTIAQLTQQLTERDAEVVQKDEQCNQLQAQIDSLTARVKELEGSYSHEAALEGPLQHFRAQIEALQAALTNANNEARRKAGLVNRVYYSKQAKVQQLEAELLATRRELHYLRHKLRSRRQSASSASASARSSKRGSAIAGSLPRDLPGIDEFMEANSLSCGSSHQAYSISPLSSPKHSQGFNTVFRSISEDSESSPGARHMQLRGALQPGAGPLGPAGAGPRALSPLGPARASFSFSPMSSPRMEAQVRLPTAAFLPSPLQLQSSVAPLAEPSATNTTANSPDQAMKDCTADHTAEIQPAMDQPTDMQTDRQTDSARSHKAAVAATVLLGGTASCSDLHEDSEGSDTASLQSPPSPLSPTSPGAESGYVGEKSSSATSPLSMQSRHSIANSSDGAQQLEKLMVSITLPAKDDSWLAMAREDPVQGVDSAARPKTLPVSHPAMVSSIDEDNEKGGYTLEKTTNPADDGASTRVAQAPVHVAQITVPKNSSTVPESSTVGSLANGHKVVHSPVSGTLQTWRTLDDIKRQLMSRLLLEESSKPTVRGTGSQGAPHSRS